MKDYPGVISMTNSQVVINYLSIQVTEDLLEILDEIGLYEDQPSGELDLIFLESMDRDAALDPEENSPDFITTYETLFDLSDCGVDVILYKAV
jgi:hypothetical protein